MLPEPTFASVIDSLAALQAELLGPEGGAARGGSACALPVGARCSWYDLTIDDDDTLVAEGAAVESSFVELPSIPLYPNDSDGAVEQAMAALPASEECRTGLMPCPGALATAAIFITELLTGALPEDICVTADAAFGKFDSDIGFDMDSGTVGSEQQPHAKWLKLQAFRGWTFACASAAFAGQVAGDRAKALAVDHLEVIFRVWADVRPPEGGHLKSWRPSLHCSGGGRKKKKHKKVPNYRMDGGLNFSVGDGLNCSLGDGLNYCLGDATATSRGPPLSDFLRYPVYVKKVLTYLGLADRSSVLRVVIFYLLLMSK